MSEYTTYFEEMGRRAKAAGVPLQRATTAAKNDVLTRMADGLIVRSAEILAANALDMAAAEGNIPDIMKDRLRLTEERIVQMADGVRALIELDDPVGKTLHTTKRPNGLHIEKVTVPLGVIAMIYEARPNVTVDAGALAFKTGNAVILRGGKEALETNKVLIDILRAAAAEGGFSADSLQLVELTDREAVRELIHLRSYIDVVIPRGGAGLIKRITEESTVPVIETGSGVCHVYIDDELTDANISPVDIVINAKVQRPSVCNSAETLLVHEAVSPDRIRTVAEALVAEGVRLHVDETAYSLLKDAISPEYLLLADEASWSTEYNDLDMNVAVVASVEEAVRHINTYGTKHSEAILTDSAARAEAFVAGVDAAAVYVNASTRFTDGFEYGFGAEIGISTQKLHARGPMGLDALTSYKYVIRGTGQIRS